jgi:hypothetical protein
VGLLEKTKCRIQYWTILDITGECQTTREYWEILENTGEYLRILERR